MALPAACHGKGRLPDTGCHMGFFPHFEWRAAPPPGWTRINPPPLMLRRPCLPRPEDPASPGVSVSLHKPSPCGPSRQGEPCVEPPSSLASLPASGPCMSTEWVDEGPSQWRWWWRGGGSEAGWDPNVSPWFSHLCVWTHLTSWQDCVLGLGGRGWVLPLFSPWSQQVHSQCPGVAAATGHRLDSFNTNSSPLPPVLESETCDQGVGRAELPPEAPAEGPSGLVQSLGDARPPWASGHITPTCASICTNLLPWVALCLRSPPFLPRTSVVGFRVHMHPGWSGAEVRNLLPSAETFHRNKATSGGCRRMDGFRSHYSAHHTCHEATGQSLTGLGEGSFEEAGLSPGAASRKQLGSGHSGTETRWAGLGGVLVGVGLTCREPGAWYDGPGLGDTVHGWEWTHPSADKGRQARGLRPGEPRSSCCPQGAGQMGTGGSCGFSDLGRSPGLLLCCLWWVTQPLWAHRRSARWCPGNNACILELGEESSSLIGTAQSFLEAITNVFMFDVHFKVRSF